MLLGSLAHNAILQRQTTVWLRFLVARTKLMNTVFVDA